MRTAVPGGQGKPGTFAFLGFTHIYGRSREGRRLIRRHTVRERLNAKLLWPVGATPAADGQGSKPDQKSVDRAPPGSVSDRRRAPGRR
jgi:hypothetical protein